MVYDIGWAEIAEIRVDLPSNITVLPQQYTLHAIKIGQPDHYFLQDATWYYESGNTSSNLTSICNGQERSGYSCSVGNGTPLFTSNGTYDYNLTVTWNGENISSGIFIQSNNNGNHVFRFYLAFGNVIRNRYHTITGIISIVMYTISCCLYIYIFFQFQIPLLLPLLR